MPGIQVVGNKFYKDGREFSGLGVCHWQSFIGELLDNVGPASNYLVDLPAIKQTWGLSHVRVCLGFFRAEDLYNEWYLNKANYYAKLDDYIAEAERLNLGLVLYFSPNFVAFVKTCYYIYGESDTPKNLAYKWSNAWELFASFVTEIVTRYKNSPSVYAWELANEPANKIGPEYRLEWAVDGITSPTWTSFGTKPEGGTYLPTAKMTMPQWQQFSFNFVNLIKSIDHTGRFIAMGAALGNSFAVGVQAAATFDADTFDMWNTGTAFTERLPWVAFRDKHYDVITSHIYPQVSSETWTNDIAQRRYFLDERKTGAELIALHKGWADSVNKPYFQEEFGATYHGDPVDNTSVDLATETANFNALLGAIIDNDIKMASAWNYNGDITTPRPDGLPDWTRWELKAPSRVYQLEALATANASMNN